MLSQTLQINIPAVILNYRKADITCRCIESLAGQIGTAVVVDNSEDDSEYEKLSGRLLEKSTSANGFPHIKLIKNRRNLGFGAGVNCAIEYLKQQSSFNAVLIINNDCLVPPGTVKLLLGALENHKGNAIVAPGRLGDDSHPVRLWYHRLTGILTRRKIPGSIPYLTGTCLLVPYRFTCSQLFDTDFFMYGEDVEFSWRMMRGNIPLVTVKDAFIHHIGSASAPHGYFFYEYHVNRGHLLLARKLARSRGQFALYFTGHLLTLTLRALVRTMRYSSLAPFSAFVRAVSDSFLKSDPEPCHSRHHPGMS